jgi:hypothetical protein
MYAGSWGYAWDRQALSVCMRKAQQLVQNAAPRNAAALSSAAALLRSQPPDILYMKALWFCFCKHT